MSAFANCGRAVAHVRGSFVPTPDLPHISGIVPDAATTDRCHSFLASTSLSRESKSEMFKVIFALARTLRFCDHPAKTQHSTIIPVTIASFNMLAAVCGTVADQF